MMPLLDGQEAAKAIRESGTADALTIPIIALTADKKPIDTEELFRVLAREFDK